MQKWLVVQFHGQIFLFMVYKVLDPNRENDCHNTASNLGCFYKE